MRKPEKKFFPIKHNGISWKINPQVPSGFTTEGILSFLKNDDLSEDLILKKTNTRLIVKGTFGDAGCPLVIKVFKRPHLSDQLKYFFRSSRSNQEWKIGQALSQRDIATPILVACGVSRRFGLLKKDVVITCEVTATEPLIQWVEKNIIQKPLALRERKEMISALGCFVRRVHDQGIFSKDFHQGNILIKTEPGKPPLFYLIDLHAIRIKKEITRRERIKMLAQFNNFQISAVDRMRFLRAYLGKEGLKGDSQKTLAQEIASASFAHWKRLWKKRKERCLRPGKGLERFKTSSWKGMIQTGYDLKRIFYLFDKQDKEIKETDGLVKNIFFHEKAKDVVGRYYKRTSFFSGRRLFSQKSPAKSAWVAVHNLIMRGIPAFVPVAFGERKRWGFAQDCFIVFEKVPKATTGNIFLKDISDRPNNTPIKEKFIFQLAQMIRWMHQTGICHPTLKSDSVGVTLDHNKVSLQVIDVNGVKIKKNVGVNKTAKDLDNIKEAFLDVLEQKGQDLFFTLYAWGNKFFKEHEKAIRQKMQKLSTKKGYG